MSFKVLFWNIENFKGDDASRAAKVVSHIRESDPDVVGFSEIKDKAALRSILQDNLSDYDFGITDGVEGIELLAGWRQGFFEQALFTQRREFKAGNPFLRPGSLLSVKRIGSFYNFLFLHTDSGRKDRDYSNRQEMFEKIWSMRQRISEIEETDDVRFLALGDLNTMGRQRRGDAAAITGEQEIENLRLDASNNLMTLLDKTHPDTWARVNQSGQVTLASNLDHVIASNSLSMRDFGTDKKVRVRGWVDVASDADRHTFVEEISDHCSIECIIEDTMP